MMRALACKGVDLGRSSLVPNWVDLEALAPDEAGAAAMRSRLGIGPIRNGAHSGKGYLVVCTHLGHGCALHFHSQWVVPRLRHCAQQGGGLARLADKAITTGNQTGMHLHR